MNQDQLRQYAQDIISKQKWWDILSRFIDVLRINIFIVDNQGKIILPPEEGSCGGRLLSDRSLGFDLLSDSAGLVKNFEQNGSSLHSINRFQLHSFALPIKVEKNQVIAFMIIGPVILNKKLDNAEYEKMAKSYGVNSAELLSEIGGIRVVSNVMINSILELLSEIVRDTVDLSIKEKELDQLKYGQGAFSEEIDQVAREIYSIVRVDELLVALLDVALKMTNTECGSIMVMDDKQGVLTVKVSKGIETKNIEKIKVKLGEGIAGLAAKENEVFVINDQSSDNRITHLLKRPEIKYSLVMPLMGKNRVFGVLNLHTKSEESKIQDNLDNLQYLSRLIASTF